MMQQKGYKKLPKVMADFSPAEVAEVTVTVVYKVKQKLGTTEYDVPIGVDDVHEQQVGIHRSSSCKSE